MLSNENRTSVIIGAGIIGLSIGWQLVRHNMPVHILERRLAGRQASWASAGMLCPYLDAEFESSELLRLNEESLAMYPRFIQELSQDSLCLLPEESRGTLFAAVDRDDCERLKLLLAHKIKEGLPVRWITGEEARRMEPLLSPRVVGGIWAPDEKQVNSRLLIEALKTAFLKKGGQLTEGCAVNCVSRAENYLVVATEDGRQIHADVVVNASGAWADQLRGSTDGKFIRPVKGQIISVAMPQHLRLKHMIRTPRIYLAPKQDGTLRIGATSEDMGFDVSVTSGAVMELLQHAWEAIPAIYEFPFLEISAGLRPISSESGPLIGSSSIKGLYHAVGHGRAGILLSPYTAYTLKDIIWKDLAYENTI